MRSPAHRARPGVRFSIIAGACILGVANAPIAYAYLTAPSSTVVTGFLYNGEDTAQYFSYMIQAAHGRFLFENLYAPPTGDPRTINILWYVLGTAAHATGASLAHVYSLARVLAGALMLVAVAMCMRTFVHTPRARMTAWLLALCATGFGWIAYATQSMWTPELYREYGPVDLRAAEAFPALLLMTHPHMLLSLACIAAGCAAAYRAIVTASLRASVAWGLMTLLVGFFHGFHIITLCVIPGAFLLMEAARERSVTWPRVRVVLPPVAAALGAFLWTRYEHAGLDPHVARGFLDQASPHPLAYMAGFGPVLILALVQMYSWGRAWRVIPERARFLLIWIAAGSLLLYAAPVIPFERRLAEGLMLPLAACAALTCVRAYNALRRRLPHRTAAAMVVLGAAALTLPTTAIFWSERMTAARMLAWPYGADTQELAALRYLGAHTGDADIIMAHQTTGWMIPWLTGGRRPYAGHFVLTPHSRRRNDIVRAFFAAPGGDGARWRVLQENNITHVYAGPRERVPGGWNPDDASFLERVWTRGESAIYRVQDGTP